MNISAKNKALKKAKIYSSFDPVSWRIVVRKSTPEAMAETLRLLSHRAIKTMEQVYYKHPEYIVQWLLDNENLARGLEKCENIQKALAMIRNHKGKN